MTWGTTKTGATDDVAEIIKRLNALNIPHYIHLDAAMYGGIPKNQINAPILPDLKNLDVDSVSVSLHKYIGSHTVNSVVISKNKPECDVVDYIGMTDTTTAGSRSFAPFSTMQRIIEKAKNLSEKYGAKIYLKREDLNHTGAHKINHCLGEALLAKKWGKRKLSLKQEPDNMV